MSRAATHLASGKVRELYALDDERLLLVASDRISTFDVVLPTAIPDKGRVLTGMSAFWFARTAGISANHLLALRPDAGTDGKLSDDDPAWKTATWQPCVIEPPPNDWQKHLPTGISPKEPARSD